MTTLDQTGILKGLFKVVSKLVNTMILRTT